MRQTSRRSKHALWSVLEPLESSPLHDYTENDISINSLMTWLLVMMIVVLLHRKNECAQDARFSIYSTKSNQVINKKEKKKKICL